MKIKPEQTLQEIYLRAENKELKKKLSNMSELASVVFLMMLVEFVIFFLILNGVFA